ncbi:mitogen-activated protein kinase kinase kinase binding [Tyrophagus putrescentiae]|nr:mitogen-activated protein kinase kinase kinase binding [Tyrophagus putrescentiae]
MSNEKDQSNLGAAPPQPPTSSADGINNASGQQQQLPPPPPYSQLPMQQQQQFPNFYGSVPMQQQQQQQYPGSPLYPQIPPPYGDPSKEQQANPPPMNPNQPPPPYQLPQQQQQHLQYMPMYSGQQVYAYPGGYNPYQPYQYQMMVPQLPPNMAVVMPDGFDASARFDGVARASVPPPPPGVAPNMAQMAMLSGQGNQVIIGQKKAKFW